MATKIRVYKREYDSSNRLQSQRAYTRTVNANPRPAVFGYSEWVSGTVKIARQEWPVTAKRDAGSLDEFVAYIDIYS